MIGWVGFDCEPLAMLWSVPQFLFCLTKTTNLDVLAMHFFNDNDFSQYVVLVKVLLHQTHEISSWAY